MQSFSPAVVERTGRSQQLQYPIVRYNKNRNKINEEPAPKAENEAYNDDAFGLVLFSSAIGGHDEIFTAAFVISSALAATLVASKVFVFSPKLPGFVTAVSILVTLVVSEGLGIAGSATPEARLVEGATCLVSLAWGFWQEQRG